MSSLIDSVVAWLEKSNVTCKRCFNPLNCFPVKMKMRIQSEVEGAEQRAEDDTETPCEQRRVSGVKTIS